MDAVEVVDIVAADTDTVAAVVDIVAVAAAAEVVAGIDFLDNNFHFEHYNYFDYCYYFAQDYNHYIAGFDY